MTVLAAVVLPKAVTPPSALACPYAIRDAGFIVREPNPYRLLVVVRKDTPGKKQLAAWLAEAADLYLRDSNIEASVLDLDDPGDTERRRMASLVVEAAPKEFPAAVLLSPRERVMVLPDPGLQAPSQETVSALVRKVALSPARDDLAQHLVPHWCAVVLAPGKNASETSALAETIKAAARTVTGAATEMGQRISKTPYLLVLPQGLTGEEVLAWSLGLDEGDTSRPRAAVVFGMARRLGPVLPADKLTSTLLVNLFRFLGKNCTCTSDPRWILGPAAPLLWGKSLQEQVRDRLGFDANNPAVLNTLAGAWLLLRNPKADWSSPNLEDLNRFAEGPPQDPASGYIEFSFGPEEPASETTAAEDAPRVDLRVPNPSVERHGLRIVLAVAGALLLVALLGGVVILLRHHRSS